MFLPSQGIKPKGTLMMLPLKRALDYLAIQLIPHGKCLHNLMAIKQTKKTKLTLWLE